MFKVAILQKKSKKNEIHKNADIIINYMKEAALAHADILLLPECFLTGYELPISMKETISPEDDCIELICETARELKIGIVLTAAMRGRHSSQNCAMVIDKNGIIVMKYAKVHTCDFSDEVCFESGDEFKVCDFHGVKLGIMICYDREYPESARVLMLKGAELILVPNDCCSMKPRLNALSTRAYENMTGVAMANAPGPNAGNSCAFSPICWDENGTCIDNILVQAGECEEGLFYAEYHMEQLRSYRAGEMLGNTFRKVKAYEPLLYSNLEPPFLRAGHGKPGIAYELRTVEDYADILGKHVKGKIDRPLGTCHPRHPDMYYPVNYGYVEGVMAEDGSEQDVYLLNVNEPVSEFEGEVIAVYHRYNDVEDKWIVIPKGSRVPTGTEILKAIYFQEKYFYGTLFCEKS